MVMKITSKLTLIGGLGITLLITVLGGYVITTFMIPHCKDVIC
ncbi:MAG: hypothetical protein ACE5RS_05880 [Nitrosopumilus sp.]|nr:hypothetical protein [Nitrosopumilus sp.]